MGFFGSRAVFTASLVLALLMVIAGFNAIFSPSGSTLFGIFLIAAAFGLSNYARNARAAYLHEKKMKGLWEWAQGLGPRNGQGRGRP